jgi:hypothetical protein
MTTRKKDDDRLAPRAICAGQRVPRHRRPSRSQTEPVKF